MGKSSLKSSSLPLSTAYDTALLDLDGVVYVGNEAVTGAPEELARARAADMHLAFVTNNASRTPANIASQLRSMGIEVDPADVVTSAQAGARMLSEQLPPGSSVYVIGGEGLEIALTERGLHPVSDPDHEVVAVAQGFGPDMPWRQVIDGAILVREGLPWVATNTDLSFPTERGLAPGNGALVRLVAEFSGRQPQVAGKPAPPLFEETLRRVGGERPLVVGDRLDTDIEGAVRLGLDSLLVMTGVSQLADVVSAPTELRPSFIAVDLSGLARPGEIPRPGSGGFALGGWAGRVEAGALRITGGGSVDDWYRVAVTAAWLFLDETGSVVSLSEVTHPGNVQP